MSVEVRVDVDESISLEYLENVIKEFPAYLDKYLWQQLLKVAKSIASEARNKAPVKTGHLRSQIFAVLGSDNVGIICEVPYALFQEYGTKYMIPKMFMNQAIENHYDDIRETIVKVIKQYFDRVK